MANNGNWMPRSAYLPINRRHVTSGHRWGIEVGTDYWFTPGPVYDQAQPASATDPQAIYALVETGWVATSLANTAGSGADLISSADKGVPNHLLTNASADLLASPALFGSYDDALQAQIIAGMSSLPRFLVCEFMGAMTVHSADEPTSGWGFLEDGATADVEAAQLAFISSDSANFQLAGNGGAGALTDVGPADDALWHLFTIELVVSTGLAHWYIDDPTRATSLGSVAITADEAPYKFGMHALTTNRPALGWVHIFYDW
jgi:hypothetical protein